MPQQHAAVPPILNGAGGGGREAHPPFRAGRAQRLDYSYPPLNEHAHPHDRPPAAGTPPPLNVPLSHALPPTVAQAAPPAPTAGTGHPPTAGTGHPPTTAPGNPATKSPASGGTGESGGSATGSGGTEGSTPAPIEKARELVTVLVAAVNPNHEPAINLVLVLLAVGAAFALFRAIRG